MLRRPPSYLSLCFNLFLVKSQTLFYDISSFIHSSPSLGRSLFAQKQIIIHIYLMLSERKKESTGLVGPMTGSTGTDFKELCKTPLKS